MQILVVVAVVRSSRRCFPVVCVVLMVPFVSSCSHSFLSVCTPFDFLTSVISIVLLKSMRRQGRVSSISLFLRTNFTNYTDRLFRFDGSLLPVYVLDFDFRQGGAPLVDAAAPCPSDGILLSPFVHDSEFRQGGAPPVDASAFVHFDESLFRCSASDSRQGGTPL